MGRPSYREQLLSSGTETIHRRGFAAVGVREITAEAGVAQGSFTNHFQSKEDFGAAVVDYYEKQIHAIFGQTLQDSRRAPLARLRSYFETIIGLFEENGWRYGCLAGNMALEAAEHSDIIRKHVRRYLDGCEDAFASVIREAQRAGEIDSSLDSRDTAAVLLEAWHGAMLRMKVERSPAPLKRFMKLIFATLLQHPAQESVAPRHKKNRKSKAKSKEKK